MTRRSQRRGILLLIVLSLLVLFVLIGVTFLVVANQYTRSAKASAKHDLKGDDPAKELDGALYLLLRGTTDTSNLTFRHNLFGDLYGRDGFAGTVLGKQDEAGGEFIRLAIRLDRPLDPNYPIPPVNKYYSGVPNRDYFAGSVLTLIDGSGRGQSARIVRYSPATTVNNTVQPAYVVVTPFESQKVFKTQFEATGFAPREADRFVINGKPFNGTGDGFNVESGELDQEEFVSERPVALLPNYRQSEADQMAIMMGQARRMITMGDGDESWDAVDYQNYLLARIPTTIPPGGTPLITDPLIPSFHRPFLINYWMQDPDTEKPWDGNNPNPFADPISSNRRRMVIARPMPQDHPYFTGSNPALTSHRAFLSDLNRDGAPDDLDNDGFVDVPITLGPWDVDNDNDGVNDSIWVDLGMPAKTAPDGRLYKPLFAVLCVDLDGRLNVNAHGVASSFKGLLNPDSTAAGASGSAVPEVTRGQGYGPADIRLEPALDRSMIDALLLARWNSPTEVALSVPPSPGFPGEDPSRGFDTLSFLKQWDMTRNFQTQFQVTAPQLPGSAYATPSDLRGIGGVYLDLAGQPRYAGMMLNNETIDDPYESDLVSPNASDSLFTVNDQEQLLRFGDMDTTAFAGRLRQLMLPALVTNPHQLRRFTTSSFDIPAPNVLAPLGLRIHGSDGRRITDEVGQPLLGLHISLSDLVRARLIANGFAKGQPQEDRLRLADEQVRLMLAPELRQGQRLDINRWLSNSRDDTTSGVNTSGVVDEPGENGTTPEVLWAGSPYQSPVRFAANDPHFKPDLPHYSRQLLARHLYCLMMLLIDSQNGEGAMVLGTDFVFDGPQLPNLPDKKKATARRIAQWAINVVDFRDPDVIMTPFEFDLEPFDENGWNVDDDYRDADADDVEDRAIVWGCEHPELVITETVAWHDRRVRDTNKEIPADGDAQTRKLPAGEDPEMFMPDQDLDQYRIPQGTLLLELYCGRNRLQNNPIAPNELYFQNKSTGQLGLDLGRLAEGSPVWRIAIGQPDMSDPKSKAVMLPAQRELDPNILNPNQFDPNDETMLLGTGSGGTLTPDAGFIYDRYVIFTNGVPGNVAGDPTRYYFNRGAAPLLEPGQYAVVGPYRPLNPNDHRNKISTITMGSKQGTPPGDPSEPSDQQILLSSNGIVYRQLANGAPLGVPNTKPAVGIMVSANILDPEWNDNVFKFQIGTGLNVSEPLPMNYYDEPTWSPDAAREFNSYYGDIATSNILPDVPFDEEDNSLFLGPARLRTGTNPSFRVAVLQRLADPTKGWNSTTNPYISIDAQPIDLTVFNGEDQSDRDPASWDRAATYANGEAYDLVDDEQDKIARHFDTRERGGVRNIDFTAAPNPILWNPLPEVPPETEGADSPPEFGGADAFWKYPLNHSLGYLNRSYENPATLMPRLNAPPEYVGDPADPFSWLVWNNRPYVSHLELMQVPSGAPWRLLYEFRGGVAGNPYEDSFTDGFPHLMNFFHSDEGKGTHANLCRIFDYVEVPSRFVGTEKRFGSTLFANIKPFASPDLWEFEMPNNKVSLFRDPGRINVNTIPDRIVWEGVDPRLNTSWADLSRSLRGKPDGERRPAFYTNPVRSAASAGLMPNDDLNQVPVNATLLRSHPSVTTEPLFGFNSAQGYEDPTDNSYFRYHKLQRLGNLLTTHSNVYAIWITVGYFEVHPWNANAPLNLNVVPMPDPVHPDGFQLGRELGSDTGEIKRHRAFYIIDRSIPVAFEPGENHNVDKSILLRRMIE